jgi:hypothetical protein
LFYQRRLRHRRNFSIVKAEEAQIMMSDYSIEEGFAIPTNIALRLCEEICREKRESENVLAGVRCWMCRVFSNNDPNRRRFGRRAGNRGCRRVNLRFVRQTERVR